MNQNGGQITVTLVMDSNQFKSAALAADNEGKALSSSLDNNTKDATDRIANRFSNLGSAISTGLKIGTVATVIAGAAAIKMSGDYQTSLNVLQSVTGATGQQMDALSKKAIQLGNDISLPGISAKDAALAMTELAKAGLGVNDVLSASKGVLSLAKAGQLDVATAATITARALNTFGLSGDKATQVADLLAAGANSSTASVEDMALALAQGGAGAKQFGISIGDTATALAIFSNAGINGSDAGTSLKTMLQALAAPSKQSADLMKKLGINLFDAKGNFVGLEQTAGILQKTLGKLTVEQRNNALATIFGSDASRVAGILADQGAAGFDKMSAAVNKQGAATDLAAAQNKGFNGALENLKSTAETVALTYGQRLLKPLTDFANLLSKTLSPTAKILAGNIDLVTIALGGLATAFATVRIAAFTSDILLATGRLAEADFAAQAASKSFAVLSTVMGATAARGVAAIALGLEALSINPVTVGIVALVAALVFLLARAGVLKDLFDKLQPITSRIATAFDMIKDAILGINPTTKVAGKNFQVLSRALVGVRDLSKDVQSYFSQLIGTLKDAALQLSAFFDPLIKLLKPTVVQVLSDLVQAFDDLKVTVGNSIGPAISQVGDALNKSLLPALGSLYDSIQPLLPALEFVGKVLAVAFGAVVLAAIYAVIGIIEVFAQALQFVLPVIGLLIQAVGFVIGQFVALAAALISTVAGIINFVTPALQILYQSFIGVFVGIYNTVIAIVVGLFNILVGILTGFINLYIATVKYFANSVVATFNAMVNGVVVAFNGIVNLAKGIGGAVVNAIGNLGGVLYNSGVALIQGLINGASSLLSKLGQLMADKVPAAIRDPFKKALGINSPSRVFAGYGANISQGLAQGILGSTAVAAVAAKALGDRVSDFGADMSADLTTTSGGGSIGGGSGVTQVNKIYNQVDYDRVSRYLAYKVNQP